MGHHPDCSEFESHTLRSGDRVLCAGCTGLAIGAGLSIVVMAAYVVVPMDLPLVMVYLLMGVGALLVVANYVEIAFFSLRPLNHALWNASMVVGFLFVVIGILHLTGNPFVGLLGVVIAFLWLDTRIQISSWKHSETCGACSQECKAYLR